MKYTDNIESIVKNFCLRKKSAVRTSAELDERIVDDALLAQRKSKTTQSVAMRPNIWRIIMRARMAKYFTVAVIALVIIIGIIELGKPVGGASTVFAAAMDSVKQARTFSCTKISESWHKERGTFLLKERRMFKEPDWERHERLTSPRPKNVGEIIITHYDTRQRLRLIPTEKTATLHDVSSENYIDEKTGELKLTHLSTRIRDYLLELSAEAVEDLGSVELDGQSVRLLRSSKDKRITTVWINPETNYPVQIELTWTDPRRAPVMFTSIQIDTELDDDLFSLEPPEGYTLTVDDSGWSDYKKKMLTKIKYLGAWCVIYANEKADQFPDELADIVTLGVIAEEALNKVAAALDDPNGPPAIQYRKPNTDTNRDWSTEVIVYEIYDQWPQDGVVAYFADQHCELIADQKRFEEMIK